MSLFSQLLRFNAVFLFLGLILYVVFGQVTVRRLRKKPEIKKALGFELVSGWDILNVAQALSLPKKITEKLDSSSISPMYANSDVLRKNTTRVDRFLAVIFYWVFILSSLSIIFLISINSMGLL